MVDNSPSKRQWLKLSGDSTSLTEKDTRLWSHHHQKPAFFLRV